MATDHLLSSISNFLWAESIRIIRSNKNGFAMEEWVMSSEEEEEDLMSSEEESDTCERSEHPKEDSSVAVSVSASAQEAQTIKLITEASLLAAQKHDLRRVMDILDINEKQARTLLIHYRWAIERLLDAYVERGADWLFSQSGIAIRLQESTNSQHITVCTVCRDSDDDLKEKGTTTMDCGHTFCNECWTSHFLVKVNEGHSKRIECMDPQCNIICDEDVIRKLLTAEDSEASQRFDRFLLESYIDDNKNVKWCPSVPNCGNALRVEGDVYCEIECICGQQFCFNCLLEPHSPCSCFIWKLWNKKCQDDSETLNWISVNTQRCPQCGKNVEKDGGCNLMTCVCGQCFCWLCGGSAGPRHSCGRYKEDQKALRDLRRYAHYYSRWKAHQDSLKLEEKQKNLLFKRISDLLEENISDLESKKPGVRDYSWLTNALEILFRSRRALSYSYPFAFHMFGDDLLRDKITETEKEMKQVLFEDLQKHLEVTVERLSQIIEGPFDEQKDRLRVIDLSVLADKSCRNMYECIENDVLSLLGLTAHGIAPYNSNGVQRVPESQNNVAQHI